MLQIAICDDSIQEVNKVQKMLLPLKERLQFESDAFYTGDDLIKSMAGDIQYDIYILDIEMQDCNGLDIARKIREKNLLAVIIFLTGYPRYIFKAYDVMVFNFLIKPVKQEKLEEVIYNAAIFLEHTKDTFCYSFNKVEKTVQSKTILYFEKKGRKVMLHTLDETDQFYMSLDKVLEQIDQTIFVRVSHSVIINFNFLKSISSDQAELNTGEVISISRAYKDHVKQKHLAFLKKRL